jgi:hypothetical protein
MNKNKEDRVGEKSGKIIFMVKALVSILVMIFMITSVSAASLSDYNTLFTTDGTSSGIIILGKNAQQNDYLAATEIIISTTIANSNKNQNQNNDETIITNAEAGDWKSQNTIVIGGPCSNEVAAQLLEMTTTPDDCAKNFTPGRAIIKMFQHPNGKISILIAGYSGEDTLMAARVFAKRADEISGDEVTIVGTNFEDARILVSKNQQEIQNLNEVAG